MLNFNFILSVGDWSHDGHNMCDDIHVKSNLCRVDLDKAYEAGSAKVGFNLCKDVCHEYEDSKISRLHYAMLLTAGITVRELDEYDVEDLTSEDEYAGLMLEPEQFADLYMQICKLGDSSLEYEIPEADYTNIIRIGGYGLYSSLYPN